MGLVSHFSPIRYQSKHQKLKFINSTLKSYINFCQTLTGPHQKSFASIYSQIDLQQIIIVGKSLKSNIPKTDEYFDFLEIKYIPYYRKEYWILCKEIELLFDDFHNAFELEEKCDQKYILVKYNDYKHADIYSAAISRRNDINITDNE